MDAALAAYARGCMLGRRPRARLGALTLSVCLCLAAGTLPALSTVPGSRPAASSTIAEVDPAVVAFVPVQRFWTPRRDISMAELRAAIEGRHADLRRVLIAADDPSSLWGALGVTPARTTQAAFPLPGRGGRAGLEARARAGARGRCPTVGPGAPGGRPQPLRAGASPRPRQLAPPGSPRSGVHPSPVRSRPHVDPRGRRRCHARSGGLPPGGPAGEGGRLPLERRLRRDRLADLLHGRRRRCHHDAPPRPARRGARAPVTGGPLGRKSRGPGAR